MTRLLFSVQCRDCGAWEPPTGKYFLWATSGAHGRLCPKCQTWPTCVHCGGSMPNGGTFTDDGFVHDECLTPG